ncbi:MAG: methyltransferase domain-containing protein [Candidatus Accumulibacter sp.]|jgi:SAM-dependent methyltransferase|uniref:class I SAM-dependent methyltransferase n=1 Tax=Accumulibacter sp. TaxID=2053492 RepID=UPI001AC23767|nr:class I SAM-dependent methyltransferase [Accumulibacter sp.]MBN8438783.1 methyltransferase domain-containing protein [Accumulibacter sp.]
MSANAPVSLTYDEQARIDRARERAKTVDALIGLRGQRVLEVGCGHGDFCKVLAEEYDCEVVGTEVLPYEEWKTVSNPNLTLMHMDVANEQRFPENHFDRIVSFVVWEHMRHPWSALKECQRILKPKGKKYLHAYLYGAPRLSHLHYLIPDPWLHLTHSPNEIMQRIGKGELPWYFWCNRVSYLHYLQYFRKLGFYITYENIIREPFPEDYYQDNEQLLGLYSGYDLRMHGFQVVLVFDERLPKEPIEDIVYSKLASEKK